MTLSRRHAEGMSETVIQSHRETAHLFSIVTRGERGRRASYADYLLFQCVSPVLFTIRSLKLFVPFFDPGHDMQELYS